MTFRDLIDAKYVAEGTGKLRAFQRIYLDANVAINTIRAAYNGTRIELDSAQKLAAWAYQTHGETLGVVEMASAPVAERSKVDWGERARISIRRAVEEAGLPDEWCCEVELSASGLWTVEAFRGEGFRRYTTGCVHGRSLATVLRVLCTNARAAPHNDNGESKEAAS